MSLYVYPYNKASESAAEISAALGATRIIPDPERSKYRGKADKTVINWGCSSLPPEVQKSKIVNRADAVQIASNKLHFFKKLRQTWISEHLPKCYFSKQDAQFAMEHYSIKMCARTVLNGHSGKGLVIVEAADWPDLPDAQLYTSYVKKKDEFRIHVIGQEVILVQRKGLRADLQGRDDVNWEIRNLANGFVFVRSDVDVPARVKKLCIETVKALGLDFAAVDVVYNSHYDMYRILEVNTAPGLCGTTIEDYKNGFQRFLSDTQVPFEDPDDVRPVVNARPFVNARGVAVGEIIARQEQARIIDEIGAADVFNRVDWNPIRRIANPNEDNGF